MLHWAIYVQLQVALKFPVPLLQLLSVTEQEPLVVGSVQLALAHPVLPLLRSLHEQEQTQLLPLATWRAIHLQVPP